jgi:hypothetical protein
VCAPRFAITTQLLGSLESASVVTMINSGARLETATAPAAPAPAGAPARPPAEAPSTDACVVGLEAERSVLALCTAALWVLGGTHDHLRPGAAFQVPAVSTAVGQGQGAASSGSQGSSRVSRVSRCLW